jgi:hypothetical protein
MIRTSINIDVEVYEKLQAAAVQCGVTMEEMILALMRYFSQKHKGEIVTWEGVHYQERRDESHWACLHVTWFGDEYEFLIDLRKVHKKSVSLILAETVLTLLEEMLSKTDHNVANYQHPGYTIAKFIVHNTIGCIFFWGIPQKNPKP